MVFIMQMHKTNNKFVMTLISVVGGFVVFSGLACSAAFAVTYGSSTGLEYTFLPSLTVSFTPNTGFVIDNLNAGNSAYSNTVTVSVSSNASDGYILAATVGSTSDNNRNNNKLVHSNNTNYFDSVASNANLSLSNLGNDKWGYATYDNTNELWSNYNGLATVGNTGTTLLSTNNAATKTLDMRIGASATLSQVSGTYTNNINFITTANIVTYNYTISFTANNTGTVTNMPTNVNNASFNTGGVVQISSTTPTADNGTFLGWCDGTVSGTTCSGTLYQPGDYIKLTNPSSSTTNAITLTAVWDLGRLYIQDLTLSQCQVNVGTNGNAANIGDNITVYDKRSSNYTSGDEGDYTVRYINGACWMTQNLRIQGTVSATDSNFDSGSINVSQYDLKTNGSSECGSSNGYSNPCSHTPDSTDMSTIGSGVTAKQVGAWYNYVAATAGTISTTSNSTNATQDICPSSWHLPTGSAAFTNSDFYKLFQSTSANLINPNNYLTAFGAVKGGVYNTGSIGSSAPYGYLWSATAYNGTSAPTTRYMMYYDSSRGQFSHGGHFRYYGEFVRCVKTS